MSRKSCLAGLLGRYSIEFLFAGSTCLDFAISCGLIGNLNMSKVVTHSNLNRGGVRIYLPRALPCISPKVLDQRCLQFAVHKLYVLRSRQYLLQSLGRDIHNARLNHSHSDTIPIKAGVSSTTSFRLKRLLKYVKDALNPKLVAHEVKELEFSGASKRK